MGWLIVFTDVFISDNLNMGPTYFGVMRTYIKVFILNGLDFFMNITAKQPPKFLITCLLPMHADSMTLAVACPHASRT